MVLATLDRKAYQSTLRGNLSSIKNRIKKENKMSILETGDILLIFLTK